MASMRDIKRRKSSIQSTQQITNAMKLVSTVKLQKARSRAEQTNPYFNYMYKTVASMLARSQNIDHKYLKEPETNKKGVVVITSNRGLAGGYNSNIVKLVADGKLKKEDLEIYAVGNKGAEAFQRRGYSVKESVPDLIESPSYDEAAGLCSRVLEAYENGEIGEIYLVYTHFKNTVSQVPTMIKLLPVDVSEIEVDEGDSEIRMNYEPNEIEALDMIIPKYVTSLLYGALVEAVASENGARMTAMDSATSNAEDIISDLSLKYNRARQSSITQELTEIIAGANAVEQ
ncbi:ATP synthase F1 subunit gamma [Lachnobacterium bovis]|jgi:F-type H+-transporting ATPase subunit gamma|uniref:ATP synthase gamma chain n=1 Tax=Lachnobacterium bovis DSM 14045 TaxID=1122142 RepID=A0A1H3G899_9FIRM|nr:ATP synthase F1 subunit gamma [Lachnobacterium bovis]SDX99267.1 F-type H+-transporting ATPase subunit gamma [Lachnobacterium bovis DSM 14045]